MLVINNLVAGFEGAEILKGINLHVRKGEIHSIMGPNGSGKSTFAKTLAGHPDYKASAGAVLLDGKNLLELEPDKRALVGLFLAYQNPVEIPGVNNAEFLRMAYNAKLAFLGLDEVDPLDFQDVIADKMRLLNMSGAFMDRAVNEGFSGGEKKKNEILQMAILEPKVAILDEIDSGLDIDALRVVAENVMKLKNDNNALIVITHYQRLLDYIKPDFIHILSKGRIARSGGPELALELESTGYNGFANHAA
jgi:Fe-S cluster assembly ATP-binding protein